MFLPSYLMGLFGDTFKGGATALVVLTLGQLVNAATGSVGYILQMTGKHQLLTLIVATAAAVNLGLNYMLIPAMGMDGAALASLVAMAVLNLVPFFIIKASYGFFTLNLKRVLAPFSGRTRAT